MLPDRPEDRADRLQQAEDLGRQVGEARRQRDQARVTFKRDYFRRWLALQPKEQKRELEDAWSRGYTEEAGI